MLLAGCFIWLHCGGQTEAVSQTTAPVTQKRAKAKSGAYESASPPKGKNWSGWRYKGKRQDCFFRVDKQCFDSKAKACKAAKS
jgi:hypothetical protein